jgi:hypothetical protein
VNYFFSKFLKGIPDDSVQTVQEKAAADDDRVSHCSQVVHNRGMPLDKCSGSNGLRSHRNKIQSRSKDLALLPSSLDEITTGPKFVSLTDFIEQLDWEYSDLDIVDRREIKHLDAEDFWRYVGKSEVPLQEPGHLSPVTVAKGIEYGVNLLGFFIEGYVGSNQSLDKEADFGKMTRGALEFARGTFAKVRFAFWAIARPRGESPAGESSA